MAKAKEPKTESYTFEGDVSGAPDWVDRGWMSYDRGPALAVPKGDPRKQPYSTVPCRVGDTIVHTPGESEDDPGSFEVVRAEETGRDPGGEPWRPPGMAEASLEDLVKTGNVSPDDMNEEARAQYEARKMGSPLNPESAKAANQPKADPAPRKK